MQGTFRPGGWGHLARIALLSVGVVALAGCATGYAFVQPDEAGSGGYYASDEPYSGRGYYDYYGTGPYYPGASGYGYYNGTSPYSDAFGWDDGYYGDYGYWSSFTFNLGISNVWGFPGYWGPWYTTGFPIAGCWRRDCGHHHRRDHRHHHDRHDSVATTPHPRLKPDAPLPPRWPRGSAPPVQMLARPAESFANGRPLPSTTFAPHDFVRAPIDRFAGERFMAMPARPISVPRAAVEPEFANRSALPMPARQGFHVAPRMIAMPAPAPRVAPVSRPSAHQTDASRTRIP
ncbi:MAG TPA: hypothetical protein VFI81_07945 [Rhodanobacteraceae bacterium]|nr:hypothetical protein [Rhodanobacteraceae bacterium]